MKSLKIIFLIFYIFFISCNKKQELKKGKIENDSVIVYNEDEYYKTKSKKIKVIDTTCDFEEKRAEKDIKQGMLTFTFIYGIGVYDISNKEMKELLSKYSIKLKEVSIPCFRPPKGFKWNCYAKLMNLEIEKKFGEKFIDSLRNIADKQFVEKNPSFIFSFYDCETTSRYINAKSYEEFLEKPENDFVNGLTYPKLSNEQRKKEKANTEVTFVIYRNGTVGKIKVESDFKITKNTDFARYFEKEAINFVKNAKWKPALYRGIEVNSDMHLNLYNK